MFLIRPKQKQAFKRTRLFSLSDLLKWILATPFFFVAAMVMKAFEEGMALILLFFPMLTYAYMVTDGSIQEIIQFFKDNWRLPVYTVLLVVSLAKLLREVNKSNKVHK